MSDMMLYEEVIPSIQNYEENLNQLKVNSKKKDCDRSVKSVVNNLSKGV